MAQRLWTQADSSNPAVAWLNAANTNALTLSSGTIAAGGKASIAQNSATGGGSFAQATTANQPTFNPTGSAKGKPVIQSLTGGQKLTSTNIPNLPLGTASGMVMGVMSFTANGSYNYPGMLIYGDPSTGKTREIDAQAFGDRLYGTTFGSDGNSGVSSGTVDRLVVAVYDAGKIYTWIDGVLVLTITTAFNTVAGVLRILDNGIGRFCDLLVVPGIADRQLYEGWLAWKNGIQDQLPAAHPNAANKSAPMIDDGVANPITGSSASTLSGLGATAAAGLAIVAASALVLTGISAASTSSALITGQGAAPLGNIASAGAGGVAVAAAGAATLKSISAVGTGTLPERGFGNAVLGDIASTATGALLVVGGVSATLAPIETVSAATADVRGSAFTTLGSIAGSATAGSQSPSTASVASVLGLISVASTASIPAAGTSSTSLATIASNSGVASPVRGAGEASISAIVSVSVGSAPLSARAMATLGGVRSDGRGGLIASSLASASLATIVCTAAARVRQDTIPQLVGPGWSLRIIPRRFYATVTRRSFTAISTGCKRMVTFPGKYAHEIRHASIDFAPALATGETITGDPIVQVIEGDLTVSGERTDGSVVSFTLEGGSAARGQIQRIDVRCDTSGAQRLEEIASVTMLS